MKLCNLVLQRLDRRLSQGVVAMHELDGSN